MTPGPEAAMRTLVEYGLANAAAAAGLAVAAVLVGLVVRRPAVRNALWLLVLVRLFLPPVWTIPLSVPKLHHAPQPPVSTSVEPAPAADAPPLAELPPDGDGIALDAGTAAAVAPAVLSVPTDAPTVSPAAAAPVRGGWPDVYTVLAVVWVTGTMLVVLRSARRVARFRRALRDARPAPAVIQRQADELARGLGLRRCPKVLLVPGRVWPSLWMPGLFARQARLILPAGLVPLLDGGQRAAVLAHELAHLKRGDPWVRWLELAACAAYWWHPLLGWFRRQLRAAEEECCDLWVVAALDGRRSYATALVETAAYLGGPDPAPMPALASGAGPVRHLQRRVTMIMRATWPARLTRAGLAAVLGLGGLGLLFGPAVAQDRKERPDPAPKGDERPKDRPGRDRPDAPPPDKGEVEKLRAEVEKARQAAREAMERLRTIEEKLARAEGRPFPPADGRIGPGAPGLPGAPGRGPGGEGGRPGDRPPGDRPVPPPPGDRPREGGRPGAEGFPPGPNDLRQMQQQIEELRRLVEQMRREMRDGRGPRDGDRPGPKEGRPDDKRPDRPGSPFFSGVPSGLMTGPVPGGPAVSPPRLLALPVILVAVPAFAAEPRVEQFSDPALPSWTRFPADFSGLKAEAGKLTLHGTGLPDRTRWGGIVGRQALGDCDISLTVTVREPTSRADFFGESWSVWPDLTFADGGYDFAVWLRVVGDKDGLTGGYRLQVSHKYQDLALVKWPDGGYLRAVPCAVKKGEPLALAFRLVGDEIVVLSGGKELLRARDPDLPKRVGPFGLAVSHGAKVEAGPVTVAALPEAAPRPTLPHKPSFRTRTWLGGRTWVFDGDEPILQLPTPQHTFVNAKLRPSYRPLLNWNAHWDIANQGAYKPGTNTLSDVTTKGGGDTLSASWTARQTEGKFETKTELAIGFDPDRRTYTYDVTSELEVKGDKPFEFRYGYDFEHHTPLDPFNWQYLVVRRSDGKLYRRPVYPVDPGPMYDLEQSQGLRVWYGQHFRPTPVVPAVEYRIERPEVRKLNTAVCAAFYDTGVSFAPETAKPGTKVAVRYRYTGYLEGEAKRLFDASAVYDSPMLDPRHHYVFAEWPTQTFSKFKPMSETWPYGWVPFMTAHNQRPTYELAKEDGRYALRLGPNSYARADLPMPGPLGKGRYGLFADARSDNPRGPGGRIELRAVGPKAEKDLLNVTHYLGNDTFDWKVAGFTFDLPATANVVSLGMGNAGTGVVQLRNVQIRPLLSGEDARPVNGTKPKWPAAPAGALADYRMDEGRGRHVFDGTGGELGLLELANVEWVKDGDRPALRFAGEARSPDYPRAGALDRGYFSHPAYKGRERLPVALAGHHGGGREYKALTLAAWVKPDAAMPGDKADVVGFGARRAILRLRGTKAPYQLSAAFNVNDEVTSEAKVAGGAWQHVAVTAEPADGQWKVLLYLNGEKVADGVTKKFPNPALMPPSLVLGTELFYFHDAYYRGLIGRVTVFDRSLSASEVRALAK